MDVVNDSPKHARPKGWKVLRRSLIAGALVLSPAFFIVMFRTVTALVRPSFGVWAWTVPVATEGCFLLLYGLDILLEWARKPKGWLRFTPYPFAAASLVLNVWADKDSLGGMLGHAIVTVAFFLPVIAAESAVRDLAVTDAEMRMRGAVADARQYAIDLCRSRRGRLWRWRIPVLLRTQILTGRLPDEVRDAITEMLGNGRTSGWQAPVRTWVLGPDGLNLSVQAETDSRRAAQDIARTAPQAQAEPSPETVTAPPSASSPRSPARTVPVSAIRRAQKLGRRAADEDLLAAFRERAADGHEPSATWAKDALPVGADRAKRLVAEYQREQPVPISRAAAAR